MLLRRLYSTGTRAPVNIGFIGLGQMGSHMALNLLTKQPKSSLQQFLVFDVQQQSLQQFQTAARQQNLDDKVTVCHTPNEIGQKCDVIVTMLPSSPHVRKVYTEGPDCLMAGLQQTERSGKRLLIDSSTIDPTTSKQVSQQIIKQGHLCVDAPVSGGVGGAQAGTLTFMVGSQSVNDFNMAQVYLQSMGKNIVRCGDLGSGQVAKICNNMLLGISMLATAETMNLGMRMGMDAKVLQGVIATSSGRCWSVDTYNPVPGVMENVPSSRGYKGGFAVELMTKDLQLAAQAAADSKSFNVLGGLTKNLFETVCAAAVEGKDGKLEKLAGADFSVVFKWMNDNAKKYNSNK